MISRSNKVNRNPLGPSVAVFTSRLDVLFERLLIVCLGRCRGSWLRRYSGYALRRRAPQCTPNGSRSPTYESTTETIEITCWMEVLCWRSPFFFSCCIVSACARSTTTTRWWAFWPASTCRRSIGSSTRSPACQRSTSRFVRTVSLPHTSHRVTSPPRRQQSKNQLQALVSPSSAFKTYREALHKSTGPTIPYL